MSTEEIQPARLATEEALFGRDTTPCLVAVEPDSRDGICLFRRVEGRIEREHCAFRPWMLLTAIPDFPLPGAQFTELEGDGYCILAEFPTHSAWQEARFRLRDEHREHLTYPHPAKLYLLRSGQTLFKGMAFEEVVRLQFDIETNGLDPNPEANRILLIAVSDNRGFLELVEGDEKSILERFAEIVREKDPDVIEGHNVFGFDFPYVMTRAARHGVRMSIGRDGSEPRTGPERNYAIGGNSRPFAPVYVYGRHIVDTYLVVQRFDWAKGALTSYGLKECARVFGFAEEERVELPRAEIARIYSEDPELVKLYARQDVVETEKLAALISPVEFYQTQMVPDNYGQVVVTGNGEKINALFIRAALAAGHAVPRMQPSRPYPGGYTEVRRIGVLDHVVKADVESLYPSLMLTHQIAPARDSLGLFLPCLRELTRRRIEAKRKASGLETEPDAKPQSREESGQWSVDSGQQDRAEGIPSSSGRTFSGEAAPQTGTSVPGASSGRTESGAMLASPSPRTDRLSARHTEDSPDESSTGTEYTPQTSTSLPGSRDYWDGLQSSYKVLINSFYGYLGGPFHWNDYDAAERVTEFGRALVVQIADGMASSGSDIIEIDTDGVYFVPPQGVEGEAAERAYIAEIGKVLPEGIRLAFDGRFRQMLSLKTKNYVLVTYSGKKIYKGASLRSRADERYGRRFLEEAVDCLLERDYEGIAARYAETIQALLDHRLPIEDLARRERVTEKTFQSEQKKRSAEVAKGVAIGEHVYLYERADGTLGLRDAYAGDENVRYYMDKLYKFAKRLEEAFEGAFDRYIPKPTAEGLPRKVQETLDLFG